MTSRNRPTDLLDEKRNSFGFQYPNNDFILGTKGDVHTFFLVINDLIATGRLSNSYQTVSHDLYRTFIGKVNLEQFRNEWPELQNTLGSINPQYVDWDDYPRNTILGEFDYQQKIFDLSQPSIADVFSRYFRAMSDGTEWMDISLAREKNKYSPRIIVCPTEIVSSRRFLKLSDEAFLESADDPLWLREPG